MAKKLHIEEPMGYDLAVWGLVSEERIWKLCHSLNQALRIKLEPQGSMSDTFHSEQKASADPNLLLNSATPEEDLLYYEDTETTGGMEYMLIARSKPHLPVDLRPFSYFFVIRFIKDNQPNLERIKTAIQELPLVRSLVDVTHIKNSKSILP